VTSEKIDSSTYDHFFMMLVLAVVVFLTSLSSEWICNGEEVHLLGGF
jgi:hypothetical protein